MSLKRHIGWSHDKHPVHPKSPAGGGGPGGFKQATPHGIDPFDEFTVGDLVKMGVLPEHGPVTPDGHIVNPVQDLDANLIILRTATDLLMLNAAGLGAARSIEEFSRLAASQAAYRLQRGMAVQARIASRTQSTAHKLVGELVKEGKPVVANIGGAGEEPGAINVNNQSQPRTGIPKLVEADGSEIGEIFEPASVDRIVANRMQPYVINWSKFAPGAFKVLKSGGTIRYFYQGATEDALIAARSLRNAGFKVKVVHPPKLVRGVSGIDMKTGAGFEGTKP
jgi:hypothetical protein